MSITQQIRDALAASDEPLNVAELLDRCVEAVDVSQIASLCHQMVTRGELTREKPPEGGRYHYRLVAGASASTYEEQDATEARVSRVTPSEKSIRTDAGTPRTRRTPARSTALMSVTGKAPSARPAPRATSPVVADLQIAITEAGVLALRRGDVVMYLSPEERARVDAFSARFSV